MVLSICEQPDGRGSAWLICVISKASILQLGDPGTSAGLWGWGWGEGADLQLERGTEREGTLRIAKQAVEGDLTMAQAHG